MVVSLEYVLRLDDQNVVDTSAGSDPLEFLQGHGQIIPGLERALQGMSVGEEKDVVVAPSEGYGERDSNAFQLIPLDAFPSDVTLEPGMGLELLDSSGQPLLAFVAELRADGVMLDFNHPLAGETLHFNVKVVALRSATVEELSHGHVHGPGHNH